MGAFHSQSESQVSCIALQLHVLYNDYDLAEAHIYDADI